MCKKFKPFIFVVLCACLLLSACSNLNASDKTSDTVQPTTVASTHIVPDEYAVILNNIISAYPWDTDDTALVSRHPELRYMHYESPKLSDAGFALIDLDANGQTELIISDVAKPFVYNVYTISNGKATYLFDESGYRSCYYVRENGYIEHQWSNAAAASGNDFYKLENGTLCFIERITLDADHAEKVGIIDDLTDANDENCFFKSKSRLFKDYQSITAAQATKIIETYQNANKPLAIEYTLLSEYKK